MMSCSNCTFMELKYHKFIVLNYLLVLFKLYLYGIEIMTYRKLCKPQSGSNCTFMELK